MTIKHLLNSLFLFVTLCGAAVLAVASCASGAGQTNEQEELKPTIYEAPGSPETGGAPQNMELHYCMIRGRILTVDTASGRSSNRMDPCAYAPCRATVLILTARCTVGAAADLETGDTVTVRFSRSLEASADLPMTVSWKLPGLQEGDEFKARVDVRMLPLAGVEFIVGEYERGE